MLDRILLVKKFGFCNEEFHDYFRAFSCFLAMCEKITFITKIDSDKVTQKRSHFGRSLSNRSFKNWATFKLITSKIGDLEE